ncbi:UDP-glucose 4-epimerase GalE [Crenobacter sp. SG2303]|uniref:UDP-glucose 4-epimerase n=1 Tax=Crenobacter oryzisoli TaxID=3056844 RepID=A0ABT7XT03_9NEIS|nr:UDP-glucose 4-epimerase GalE [Crenobacter sp. SG2303]MDN0076853.1 UDP-glucose 4-epimerase GalE [Crenobacter sp. SG2303]
MILVTGGAGYIGSHTCLELLNAGFELVVLDNLCNSKAESLRRVQALTGKTLQFVEGDIRDAATLDAVFRYPIDAVIHFAGLKAVGESVAKPLEYYDTNVTGTLTLLAAMRSHGVKQFVFSSSATVYGDPGTVQYKESMPFAPVNPYGRTKAMIEQVLQDLVVAEPDWRIASLRYFNPVGAHESGQIGEDPNGIPNNLMPFISQVAVGKLAKLKVFGNDYPTPDGTGVRDYIHVVDLALGHVKALEALQQRQGLMALNLGAGRGYSVLEVIAAFAKASGREIPYELVARRPGDLPEYYADPSLALSTLGWQTKRSLDDICRDCWHWQSQNPAGYP